MVEVGLSAEKGKRRAEDEDEEKRDAVSTPWVATHVIKLSLAFQAQELGRVYIASAKTPQSTRARSVAEYGPSMREMEETFTSFRVRSRSQASITITVITQRKDRRCGRIHALNSTR